MKKWFKRMAAVGCVSLLLILAVPGQVTGKSCSCYSLEAAKNVCWTQNEYVDSHLISGYCEGPSCYATVEVICYDIDHKTTYKKTRPIWGNNCAACISTSGGGGSGDSGFDDIDGDYGNWHDPNWM